MTLYLWVMDEAGNLVSTPLQDTIILVVEPEDWVGLEDSDMLNTENWGDEAARSSSTGIRIGDLAGTSPLNTPDIMGSPGIVECLDLTIDSSTGGVLNGGSSGSGSLMVYGDWTNDGTYNADSETVTFAGTDQTLGGAVSTAFNDVIMSGTGTKTSGIHITMASLDVEMGSTLDFNGKTITVTGNGDIDGTLSIDANAALRLSDSSILTVNAGGLVRAVGTAGHEATVTNNGSGDYTFTVNGEIEAQYAIFEYMDEMGINITSTGTMDETNNFSYCTFQNGATSGESSRLLTINSNQEFDPDYPIQNAVFTRTGDYPKYNVAKSVDQGLIRFNPEGAGSDFWGYGFELDDESDGGFNRIYWEDPLTGTMTIGTGGSHNYETFGAAAEDLIENHGIDGNGGNLTFSAHTGTYVEMVRLTVVHLASTDRNIVFSEAADNDVTIDGTGKDHCIDLEGCKWVTIEGYDLYGSNTAGISITGSSLNNAIIGSRIESDSPGTNTGILIQHSGTSYPTSTQIYNNEIVDFEYGIFDDSSDLSDICYNTVFTDRCLFCDGTTAPVIMNNILYCTGTTASFDFAAGVSGCTWGSNISDYNDLYGNTGYVGNWKGALCSTLSQWQTASDQDDHSISEDPVFSCDPAGSVHIQSCSGCIQKGAPIPGITTDIDGETRDETYPDIGADEWYQSTHMFIKEDNSEQGPEEFTFFNSCDVPTGSDRRATGLAYNPDDDVWYYACANAGGDNGYLYELSWLGECADALNDNLGYVPGDVAYGSVGTQDCIFVAQADPANRKINIHDPLNGNKLAEIDVSSWLNSASYGPKGLAFKEGTGKDTLFVAGHRGSYSDGTIYILDFTDNYPITDAAAVDSLPATGVDATGLTWDGNRLWALYPYESLSENPGKWNKICAYEDGIVGASGGDHYSTGIEMGDLNKYCAAVTLKKHVDVAAINAYPGGDESNSLGKRRLDDGASGEYFATLLENAIETVNILPAKKDMDLILEDPARILYRNDFIDIPLYMKKLVAGPLNIKFHLQITVPTEPDTTISYPESGYITIPSGMWTVSGKILLLIPDDSEKWPDGDYELLGYTTTEGHDEWNEKYRITTSIQGAVDLPDLPPSPGMNDEKTTLPSEYLTSLEDFSMRLILYTHE
jgi:hypothetical protein